MALIILQALALVFLLGGAVWLLARHPGSMVIQLAIAVVVGLGAAVIVLVDRVDLVPDELEEPLAAAIVGILVGLVALNRLTRR